MIFSLLPTLIFGGLIFFIFFLPFFRKKLIFSFSAFSKNKLSPSQIAFTGAASFLLFLTIWNLFSLLEPDGVNRIPGPFQTLLAAWRLLSSGKLIEETWISCYRIFIGFSFASLIGVFLGSISGTFLLVNRLIVPVVSFLRYIPPTAFISLLIVYFGIGEAYKYAVIFFGVIFFIIQMVIDAVEDIDRRYIEIALTNGFGNFQTFKEVILPASWPRVWDILRINLSASWTFLVVAEIIGADKGLGHLIAVSQRYMRIDELYVGILTFGLIGILTDRVLDQLSRQLFKWHYVSIKQ